MFLNLEWNLLVKIVPETGSEVKKTGLTVTVSNYPTSDSPLLPLNYREHKNALR